MVIYLTVSVFTVEIGIPQNSDQKRLYIMNEVKQQNILAKEEKRRCKSLPYRQA